MVISNTYIETNFFEKMNEVGVYKNFWVQVREKFSLIENFIMN